MKSFRDYVVSIAKARITKSKFLSIVSMMSLPVHPHDDPSVVSIVLASNGLYDIDCVNVSDADIVVDVSISFISEHILVTESGKQTAPCAQHELTMQTE